jgi:hypothetical protein
VGFKVGFVPAMFGVAGLGRVRHGRGFMVRSGSERCGRVGSGKLGLGFGFRGCVRCDTVWFGTVWKGMGF